MIKNFIEKWNQQTPFAKVLTGFLVAIVIIGLGHALFINKYKKKNFRLAKKVPPSLLKVDEQKNMLEALELKLKKEKMELDKLSSKKFREIPTEQEHIRVISAFDNCLERCGMQILQRNEKKITVAENLQTKGNTNALNGKLGTFVCTYQVQGFFNNILKFFDAVNTIDEIFFLKDIKLTKNKNRQFDSNQILMTFKLHIIYIKK